MTSPLRIIIFGASGDLTARKLVPALFTLHRKGRLPRPAQIFGVSRRPLANEELRRQLAEMARQVMHDFDESAWRDFAPMIEYVAADASSREGMKPLIDRLQTLDQQQPGNRLYYLSVKPELYAPIARILGETGLSHEEDGGPYRRIVVEKPFGRDAASARKLNEVFHEYFRHGQIYRIDHYLGKETVQNIVAFRFGNTLFEPLWNRRYVDHIQITAAEKGTVGDRGDFYDQTGVLRDMLQSHLLQVLAFTLLEQPHRWAADELRDATVAVLNSVRIYSPSEVKDHVVLGQYAGYRQEPNVNANSRTPTYAAVRLYVENDRWRGVPMYLRSGKGLKARVTEVVIQFRRPEQVPFPLQGCTTPGANRLTLRLQPDEGIRLSFQVKQPDTADGFCLQGSDLSFSYEDAFGRTVLPEAYERLLLDAIHGDASLFMRADVIERAWEIVDPIIAATERDGLEPIEYPRGSWGPSQAEKLLHCVDDGWQCPAQV